MFSFDKDICSDFDKAIHKEWLETNGLGGYASSTIIGANTRGYHGLLIYSAKTPLQRILALSKIEESVIIDGKRFEISCNQYPNTIYPEGYKYLNSFGLEPFPTFQYIIDNSIIEKSIFMVYGKNAVFVTYRLIESQGNALIELRPLIACRDFHSRMHESLNPDINSSSSKELLEINMNGIRLNLLVYGSEFNNIPYWYRNFVYEQEMERGQENNEDLYSPGYFIKQMKSGEEISFIAFTDSLNEVDIEKLRSYEISRRAMFIDKTLINNVSDPLKLCVSSLFASADQFLVKRSEYQSIIAGYHWFGDWGRDSMIALPGLTLVTNRYEIAEEILLNYAKFCDQGMIPNCYPEFNEKPQYNSVDASLWFIYAIKKYLDYTDNLMFIESELFDTISEIIWNYREGTRYNIHADKDGLLYAGEKGTQLTWMDAKVGDLVVTPRIGKAVEINALWYNALKFMEEISIDLDHKGSVEMYSNLANKVKKSFNEKFWNNQLGCLYDCIDGEEFDDSVRPNQIFAISLPYQVLINERFGMVIDIIQKELLTPYGLRSLSPNDRKYIGNYQGDQFSRDMAYHQGTVWSWLMGPFISAYIRTYEKKKRH